MKIFVKVKPKAKEEKLKKIDNINFKAWVKEVPEKGKANLALIKLLAKHFNVDKSSVQMLSGSKSRLKIVEIIKKG